MIKKYLLIEDCYSGKIVITCESDNNNYKINAYEHYSEKREKNIFSKFTYDKVKANDFFKEAVETCRKKAIENLHNGFSSVIFGKKWVIRNRFDYNYACMILCNNSTCCLYCDDFKRWEIEKAEIKKQSEDVKKQAKELGII